MDLCIYTDADNTLWDTDAVFRDAQLSLLQDAEILSGRATETLQRLEFVRAYDQAIAAQHHAHLKYPPALLVRALEAGLSGLAPKEATRRVLAEGAAPDALETAAVERYMSHLKAVPPLLPTVREGLTLARSSNTSVYVITEGRLESARERLAALSIESLIDGVLSATKSQDLYSRLIKRAAPRRAAMIGDQPDRDTQMAQRAGMLTVLVRSRFRPVWTEEITQGAATVLDTFLEAVRWLLDQGKVGET